MSEIGRLALAPELRGRLAAWARETYPNEACGLLLGQVIDARTEVVEATRARNVERERPRERYTVHPEDHLAAELSARARGLAVVGAWHSHPDGPATPSETDRAGAAPGWSYVIVSLARAEPCSLRAFRLAGERFVELQLAPTAGARR